MKIKVKIRLKIKYLIIIIIMRVEQVSQKGFQSLLLGSKKIKINKLQHHNSNQYNSSNQLITSQLKSKKLTKLTMIMMVS